ncbi:MAG: hypothetical protein U0R52_02525 [Solirubrobacterales bacterium]
MKTITGTLLAAGALALLAGCGGGGGDTTGVPTGDVSKADYIAQADQVCQAQRKKLQKESTDYFVNQLGLPPNQSPTPEQFATFAKQSLIPSVQSELDQLRQIEAPSEDADRISKVYDTAQQELAAIKKDPSSVASGDSFAKANKLAQEYGFKVCGAG